MCNSSEMAFRERYFGRQLADSGTLRAIDAAGQMDPVYFPTNPLSFDAELGFMGARYLESYFPVAPLFMQPGYAGVLPLKEQPRLDMPQPYREAVLF